MKFGIAFANVGPFAEPALAAGFAESAEAAGFESIWTVEHVVVPAGYESTYPYDPSGKMPGPEDADIPDPLAWLSFVAARTTTLRLGTGILIVPQRNPIVLAKAVASLDHLSGGRMEFGIGVGWLEEEFDALGVEFAGRGRRTDEYLAAMRVLWSGEAVSHHGEFVNFDNCISRPRPTKGTVPIHVGGHSEAAARRAGRIGDGFFPGRGTHEQLASLIQLCRATAEAEGRDPNAIEITAAGNGAIGSRALDEVEALRAMGVDRVIVPGFLFWADTEQALMAYGDEVIGAASGS